MTIRLTPSRTNRIGWVLVAGCAAWLIVIAAWQFLSAIVGQLP